MTLYAIQRSIVEIAIDFSLNHHPRLLINDGLYLMDRFMVGNSRISYLYQYYLVLAMVCLIESSYRRPFFFSYAFQFINDSQIIL